MVSNKDLLTAIAYVDGSYNNVTKEFSYGAVIFYQNNEYQFSQKFDDPTLATMHNVAGELAGAQKAMNFCLEKNIKNLKLHYDYAGIEKWCTQSWKANNENTKKYQTYYLNIKEKLNITFVKVKAHSNNKFNDRADRLAKRATKEYYESCIRV